MLKMLLYPNMKIYIVSSVGSQAQETFLKLEDLAKNNIASIPSLKDIFINEIVKSNNSDGFSHDKAGFKCTTFNGSSIFTLNSVPDNIRGKRSQLLLIDESAFCSEDLISIVLPFITQNTDFQVSTEGAFNTKALRKQIPTQVVYSSSAGSVDSKHFKVYKEYALKMIAGDSNYFVADIPCDIPLDPIIDGEHTAPLLSKQQIEDELRTNPDKAKREYYNKFQTDGGESQIIKWSQIRRNETFLLPQLANHGKDKFALALDPARINDNSIISAMKIIYDDNIGYCGEIVNCINLIDLGKRKKAPMKTQDQIKTIKQMILDYNGQSPDYENIEAIMIDTGAGGGGISAFADNFLEDWIDSKGETHKGFIDPTYDKYKDEVRNYPNASHILKLVDPKMYKKQMVEELIELMKLDLIKFPKEYDNKPEVAIPVDEKDSLEIKYRPLSIEEQVSLANIDIMKTEVTSIHKFENAERTNVRYALPKEKENRMHDDRFYTLIMLAHYLYELRRSDHLGKSRQKREPLDVNGLFSVFKKPTLYK